MADFCIYFFIFNSTKLVTDIYVEYTMHILKCIYFLNEKCTYLLGKCSYFSKMFCSYSPKKAKSAISSKGKKEICSKLTHFVVQFNEWSLNTGQAVSPMAKVSAHMPYSNSALLPLLWVMCCVIITRTSNSTKGGRPSFNDKWNS